MSDPDLRAPEKPDGFSLALNFWPIAHLAAGLALAFTLTDSAAARLALFALWLYWTPPLCARLLIALYGRPEGEFTMDQRGYRVWWALFQLQLVFNRLPALEEALRLVPGLYAVWIAAWGGRISPFAYVGPRALITDRFAVTVGRGAALGFASSLAGHMAARGPDGRWRVVVAGPRVGDDALLGGAAGLGPGATLAPGAMLPSGRRVGPFDVYPRAAPAPHSSQEAAR